MSNMHKSNQVEIRMELKLVYVNVNVQVARKSGKSKAYGTLTPSD